MFEEIKIKVQNIINDNNVQEIRNKKGNLERLSQSFWG